MKTTSILTIIALLIGLSFSVCNAQNNEEFFIEEESPVIKTEKIDSTKTSEEKKINLVKENQEEFSMEEESPVVNSSEEKVDSMQAFGEKQLNYQKNQIEEFQPNPEMRDYIKEKLIEKENLQLKKQLSEKNSYIDSISSILLELERKSIENKTYEKVKVETLAEAPLVSATKDSIPPKAINNQKKEKTAPVNSGKKETSKVSLPKKGTLDINEETKTIRVRKSDLEAKKDEIKKLEDRGYKPEDPMDR